MVRQGPLLWPAAVLLAVSFLAYWPALNGGFIWDDDTLVTDSTLVKAPDGLYRMWFTTEPLDYWPLTNTSFWLEWRLWGMRSSGYHATNLLLHLVSGLLVWAILRRLSIRGGLLAAALFVLHPVNVESVAWIAQRKNTLSMVFFLLSILWYLRSIRNRKMLSRPPGPQNRNHEPVVRLQPPVEPGINRWYWLSLAMFVLAMLSKGSVAILPGVLLLIAWWRRGAISRADVIRASPFFVVAVAFTLLNIWFQSHLLTGAIREATIVQRLLGAGAIVWFYLFKALVPIRLMFVYPQWDVRGDDLRWWLPACAAVATTAILFWQRDRTVVRGLLLAWLFFCLGLLPVMGLTDVYLHALFARGRSLPVHGDPRSRRVRRRGLTQLSGLIPGPLDVRLAGSVLVAALGLATWRQTTQYANGTTIYRSTLSRNPAAWMAHNNLALSYLHGSAADFQEAVAHLRAGLAINPKEPSLHHNLGITLFQMDRFEEAAEQHREAVRLQPDYADAHSAWALIPETWPQCGSGRIVSTGVETATADGLDSLQPRGGARCTRPARRGESRIAAGPAARSRHRSGTRRQGRCAAPPRPDRRSDRAI